MAVSYWVGALENYGSCTKYRAELQATFRACFEKCLKNQSKVNGATKRSGNLLFFKGAPVHGVGCQP
jgi:hypothetical protein